MQTLTPEQTTATQPQYEITEDDRRRQKRIQDAWVAYDGELDPPLKPMRDQPDDNVVGNYVEDKVDTSVSFLFGKELEITIEEGAPQEAQDFLNTTWGEKEARIPLLQKLAMNGAMSGEAFLRIVPNRDGSFRLVPTDPSTIFVKYAPQDCETVLLYCIEYCADEKQTTNKYERVYYREEIARLDPPEMESADGEGNPVIWSYPFGYQNGEQQQEVSWQIQHWSKIGERGTWMSAGDPILWPYPFPPLHACQNFPRPNEFWGKSDATKNLIALNKALNLTDSDIQKLGRIYSHPILYATGMGSTPVEHTPGRIASLPLVESAIHSVDIRADIPSLLSAADRFQSRIDEQSGVPGIATGRSSAMPHGPMSGIAIELMFMSLIKRTDTKRCLYGKLIIDVSKALLVLVGFSPDIKIILKWQNPLPNDDLGAAQAATVKKTIGVSDATLLEEMGYDPNEEMERNQQEDAVKMTNFSRGMGMPPGPSMMQQEQPGQGQQPQGESPFLGRGQ